MCHLYEWMRFPEWVIYGMQIKVRLNHVMRDIYQNKTYIGEHYVPYDFSSSDMNIRAWGGLPTIPLNRGWVPSMDLPQETYCPPSLSISPSSWMEVGFFGNVFRRHCLILGQITGYWKSTVTAIFSLKEELVLY